MRKHRRKIRILRLPDQHDNRLALISALEEVQRYRLERNDALRAVEELQEQLADSQALSRVGTWRRVAESDKLFWSDQTYRIHGLEPGSPIDRELAIALVHENDRERVRVEFDSAVLALRSFRIIYRIRRPDGQIRILHADNMVSTGGPEGKIVLYGAVHDITETPLPLPSRPAAEKEIPENSLIIDPTGIIMRYSGSFKPLVGNLEAGSSAFRLFSAEESHEVLADAMDGIEKDMQSRVIVLNPDLSGGRKPRRFELRPWSPFGDWWGFVMTQADEQTTSGELLEPATAVRDTILVSGAWERDMVSDTIVWSKAMYDITERTPDSRPLTRNQFADLVHEDDLEEFKALSERLDRTKQPLYHQFRIRVPSGKVKVLRVHAEYISRTQPDSHILGTLTDISRTTDLEDAVRISDLKERRLLKVLDSSRQELMMTSLRLQTAQQQERLQIATELHDEAGGLLTALNLALSELRGHSPDSVLNRAAELLDRLTEQIRVTSRKLRPSVLDRFGLVHGLEQLAENMAALGGWQLELDLPSTDSYMENEVTEALFGIAREALLNALKHADATKVRLKLTRRPNAFHLEFEDDGIGLPEKMLPHISDGLGIATMRDRAETLGGTLTVRSTESGGTRVCAFLPSTPQ